MFRINVHVVHCHEDALVKTSQIFYTENVSSNTKSARRKIFSDFLEEEKTCIIFLVVSLRNPEKTYKI